VRAFFPFSFPSCADVAVSEGVFFPSSSADRRRISSYVSLFPNARCRPRRMLLFPIVSYCEERDEARLSFLEKLVIVDRVSSSLPFFFFLRLKTLSFFSPTFVSSSFPSSADRVKDHSFRASLFFSRPAKIFPLPPGPFPSPKEWPLFDRGGSSFRSSRRY